MLYRVTKQFPRGPEIDQQKFVKREMAEQFIQEKLQEDARFKLQTIYRLYDDLDMLLKEYAAGDANASVSGSGSDSASSGKPGGTQRFSPTPFNTAPRPGGVPPSSFRGVGSKDDEDNKQ